MDGSKSIANLNWQPKEFSFLATMICICTWVLSAILFLKNLSPEFELSPFPSVLQLLLGPLFHSEGINSMALHRLFLLRMPLLTRQIYALPAVLRSGLWKVSLSNDSLSLKWLKCTIVFGMSSTWKEALHQKDDKLSQFACKWVAVKGIQGCGIFSAKTTKV